MNRTSRRAVSHRAGAQRDASNWTVSRRVALGGIGLGVLAVAAGTGVYVKGHDTGGSGHRPGERQLDFDTWQQIRGSRYYIAHRGSGDVRPEHTMPAYQAAVDWGAQAMEVSTSATSDGVLVCMHDLTLDRTTNAHGPVDKMSAAELDKVGVVQPQLGPAWTTPPLTGIPLFSDVLDRFGGHVVLCVEAKRDADYPQMMELIVRRGLQKSVIVKAFHTSSRIKQAKQAGYPVFSYLSSQDTTPATIAQAARLLEPHVDCLVLPTTTSASGNQPLSAALVNAALRTGIPIWVYPVHRRSDADYFFNLGVSGVIASSYGYVSSQTAAVTSDTWKTKAIASGEMTMHPEGQAFAPDWTGAAELTLAKPDAQHFITLGQLSPVEKAAHSYQISVQARWNTLPSDLGTNITLAFGHTDDRYYEHQLGVSNGYHAIIRANGSLELYAHLAGQPLGIQLGGSVSTSQPAVGEWMHFQLKVTPTTISWSRQDAGSSGQVAVDDDRFRGGYLHIGRSASDSSSISFQRLRVS